MDASAQLIWSVIFGSIGIAYFSYGKKQKAIVPLLAGIGLLIFPYFISTLYSMICIGITLIAIPYFIKR